MLIFRLFWEFFKTGLFAIGGGLATLPFLYDMQAATGWFTLDDISNMIAISESTPGPGWASIWLLIQVLLPWVSWAVLLQWPGW